MKELIKKLPKAELHLHIEGTFEPELMFEIAKRNGIPIKYNNVDEIRAAYKFNNLQEFLDIYYAGANVLLTEQDFYDLTWAYLLKCKENNVVHTEIFVDPQTHTERGVAMETVINGITNAMSDAEKKLNITSKLIVSFLRHMNEESALKTFDEAIKYKDKIIGFGLDSSEVGHPPVKFKNVYEKVINKGFKAVAHAGEEGPSEYIWEALNILNVSRIDHGIRCVEDDKLVEYMVKNQIPLTVCPLSNLELQVVKNLKDHPLKKMLDKGLMVTINSDDPAYFRGYINENYLQTAKALSLTEKEIIQIAKNSFTASYLSQSEKDKWIAKIDEITKE